MALNFGLIGDLTFAECIKVNRGRRVQHDTSGEARSPEGCHPKRHHLGDGEIGRSS